MKVKRLLAGMLCTLVIAAMASQSVYSIPELIHLRQGQDASYSFFLPVRLVVEEESICTSSSEDESLGTMRSTLQPHTVGSTEVRYELLGCIPVGASTVTVSQERILIPGGQSIGLAMTTEGVFIVEAAEVYRADGTTVNPAQNAGLTSGDCILRIGGKPISSMEQLTQMVQESNGTALSVEYLRDGERRTTQITPVEDESGIPRIGVWVRDSTAGIGTMTYIDPETMGFGALGHAVTDIDTGRILPIDKGNVYQSQIMEVKKGEKGEAGELHGVFTGSWEVIDRLSKNTESGVYGTVKDIPQSPLYPGGLPVAARDEVVPGSATLLTTVDTRGVRAFDCEILRINPQQTQETRSMVIRITDPELLSITGGIVQGMSGSPIIQDGKLVGAVTHVLVNDPTRGYGIFIENMLDAAE